MSVCDLRFEKWFWRSKQDDAGGTAAAAAEVAEWGET